MRVLFISDLNLNHNCGGAQVSNDIIIKKGVDLGYDITLHNYDSSPTNLLYKYDIVISSNLEVISQTSSYLLDFILNHNNHIRLEHDSCSYLNKEYKELLFRSSKINFFLSEFHLQFFKDECGDIFGKTEIVYDPIDSSVFYDANSKKQYDIVYCGYLHPLKGIYNLINFSKENPNRTIDIFGWSHDQKIIDELLLVKNIRMHDRLPHEYIPDIFRVSKYIYHSPIVKEPFCRMVAEALLCGCKFIGNKDKIGSLKEFEKNKKELFVEKCKFAPDLFWQKIL